MLNQITNVAKVREVICGLFIASALIAYSGKPSRAALTAYYTFDDSTNLGADSSGNGNNLTVSSTGATFDSSAKIGTGAVSFDGIAGVLTGNAAKIYPAITTGISLSFYVQTTDTTNATTAGANNGKNISRGNGGFNALTNGTPTTYRAGASVSSNSGVSEDNVWRLIVVSLTSGGTQNLYVDGSLKATASGSTYSIGSNAAGFAIGARASNTAGVGTAGTFFVGNIDDFAIYNEPLTADQDAGLFNGTLTPSTVDNTPEPASLSLLGIGGLLLIRRRRASA